MGWLETIAATVAGGALIGLAGLAVRSPGLFRAIVWGVMPWAFGLTAVYGAFAAGLWLGARGTPVSLPLPAEWVGPGFVGFLAAAYFGSWLSQKVEEEGGAVREAEAKPQPSDKGRDEAGGE